MELPPPIRVMLVDDHQIVIDGLKSLLAQVPDIRVIGEANSGQELLRALEFLKPDLLVVDVSLPGMDGVEICQSVKKKWPKLAIVALTMHNDRTIIQAMLKAGALGYVLKNTSREELVEAIHRVHAGQRFLGSEVEESLQETGTSRQESGGLLPGLFTSREREILALIAAGYSNTEIGDKLDISHRTVDTHRTNLMKKLDVHNIAGLIRYAFRHGIID